MVVRYFAQATCCERSPSMRQDLPPRNLRTPLSPYHKNPNTRPHTLLPNRPQPHNPTHRRKFFGGNPIVNGACNLRHAASIPNANFNIMKLSVFLDYYKPLDSKIKIDKLFELCYRVDGIPVSHEEFSSICSLTKVELQTYLKDKYNEHQAYINERNEKRKKLKKQKNKKKRGKNRRQSPSVFNKNDYIYKRISIISTAM